MVFLKIQHPGYPILKMKQMSLNMTLVIMSHAQDETLAYCRVNPFSQTIQRMPKDGFENGVDDS